MSFENIIGQDIAVNSLKGIIAQDTARGSYLFFGPDGIGKRTAAIEFAKAINHDDIASRKIDSGNHPDVFIVYPEGKSSSIKIEKIREIIYQASLKPYEAKKRIFIISDAEAMTLEAQNALLKLLEEPPQNHILILTSSNAAALLPTVLSRCKVVKFYSLSQSRIQEFLEARNMEEKEAVLFSHMAMGSLGRAMELKEGDIIARRDQVVNDFFLRKSALLKENVLSGDLLKNIGQSLYMLLCWYRDLLVSKFTQAPDELLNADRSREIFSYASRFSREKLQKDVLAIMKTIGHVRANVNPKIALFNLAVELKRG
ncbi:MAG: DNA polymerase III subunit [Candidatus Gorgyraea atricola]|nr:DNA polymerase III subunit [Candidatus Gorgyraea atricola]